MWVTQQKSLPGLPKPQKRTLISRYNQTHLLLFLLLLFFLIILLYVSQTFQFEVPSTVLFENNLRQKVFTYAGKIQPQEQQDSANTEGQMITFVLGMHHAMTSVATKLMIDTNIFYAGEPSELLLRPGNSMKYWELKKAVRANQRYFDKNRDISNPRASRVYGWLGYGVEHVINDDHSFENTIVNVIKDLSVRSSKKITLIKDPRMSITAGSWLSAARQLGLKPNCVILVREPVETVYRFLADYNDAAPLSAREWASVWERYTWNALYQCFSLANSVEIVKHESYGKSPIETTIKLVKNILNTMNLNGNDEKKEVDVPKDSIPDLWREKHLKKELSWKESKQFLPFMEESLLSSQGLELAKLLREENIDINKVRKLVQSSSMPNWMPLKYQSNIAYAVWINEPGDWILNAKVLIRSITAFDASRTFLLLTTLSSLETSSYAALGWKIQQCDPITRCETELNSFKLILTFEKCTYFVIGQKSANDGASLIVENCPNGNCVHKNIFQAYANIGGRVSEV